MTAAEAVTLAPEDVRALLAECVTVVRPGEVLILRCPEDWAPEQVGEMQQWASWWLADNAPDIRAFVVPHLDMAVVQPETDEAFAERVGRILPDILRLEQQRQAADMPSWRR